MKISEAGIRLIKESEGLRLVPYRDAVGTRTIGWGHVILSRDEYAGGITEVQAERILQEDVSIAEVIVEGLIPSNAKPTQGQFDALVDFCYNLGKHALLVMLAHGWDRVPEQFPLWCHAGGHVLPGLMKRRMAEVTLWNSGH
jgi:lysozyme